MRIVFDLDGTLLLGDALEGHCFLRACRSALGLTGLSTDWGRYEVVTDLGIARQAAAEAGRSLTAADERRFATAYAAALTEAVRAHPSAFRAVVPGAREVLAEARSRHRAGIATGNLRSALQVKVAACGLDLSDLPVVAAEDVDSRADLVRRCLALLGGGPAVSVGDGVWDVAAAREAGVAFVGIAPTAEAELRLRTAGAEWLLRDYLDVEAALELMEHAALSART